MDDANAALVRLEDEAFALVRQQQTASAWELLNSAEYRHNKTQYGKGLASFSKVLQAHSERAIQSARREAMSFLVAAVLMGTLVALILLSGIYSMYRVLRSRSALGTSAI